MPDTAGIARLERSLEKLTDAVTKIGENVHAIQLEQALQKAGIEAIKKASEYTSSLLSNLRSEYDVTKDKVAQLDGEVFSEGGLKDTVKKLNEKATAGRTIWRVGAWIIGAIITLGLLVGSIGVLVQQFVSSAPSPMGKETNAIVKELKEKVDNP